MRKVFKGSWALRSLATGLSLLSAALGGLHLYRIRTTSGAVFSAPKMVSEALSPFVVLIGGLGAALSWLIGAPLAMLAGLFGVGTSAGYIKRLLTPHDGFEHVFGHEWQTCLSPEQTAHMLPHRWNLTLLPAPKPRWERDIPFWTIPGSDRQLLCDLWAPPKGTPPSGLAFIYLHGSGWHFIDKDVGTRPMFRHLAAQGHVVMDVAYRLCPEVNWRQMAGDPKRAIAWMKAHAAKYGVDPAKIVLAGASAGGQLALLSAFTPKHPVLTPEDVREADLSVAGVVSWYGPGDMRLYYTHADVPFGAPVGDLSTGGQALDWMTKSLGFDMAYPKDWRPDQTVHEAMMHGLFGGSPEEVPDAYRLFSPVEHIGPHCPPTLLLQGEHDCIVPVEGARILDEKLRAAGTPVVYVEYPQTEHGFDLIFPQVSPPAQAALYETERFLALLAAGYGVTDNKEL
jgi:acetyl esterase/lipase